MMILSSLVAIVAASAVPSNGKAETVQDRSFYVVGWQCEAEGCRSNPRQLGLNLRFKGSPPAAMFDQLERTSHNWNVRFECALAHDRLVRCEVTDNTFANAEAGRIALKIANAVRVEPRGAKSHSFRPRAIVSISYDTSDCPSWACTTIPPFRVLPPPAPPSR